MEELVNWGETYSGTDNDNLYKQNGVIVCQKPDGNYYYYYMNDFFSLVNAGKLQFQMGEQDRDQFLAGLQAGEFTTSGYYTFQITDENGDLLYTDCWNFGQSLIEKYAPVEADNLLQVVNNNPQLNGRLSLVYDNIATALQTIYEDWIMKAVGIIWKREIPILPICTQMNRRRKLLQIKQNMQIMRM